VRREAENVEREYRVSLIVCRASIKIHVTETNHESRKTRSEKKFAMKVKIEQPDEERLAELRVKTWPTLEKQACDIDWVFDCTEESYFLEGRVIVETADGRRYEVKKGDLATFPRGLACTWHIIEPMRKHFNLKND